MTNLGATALGRKISSTNCLLHLIGMNLALQRQRRPNAFPLLKRGIDLSPKAALGAERVHVADDEQAVLGTRQGDIHAVLSLQEPDLPISVASDEGQEDDLVLLALEVVHERDANPGAVRKLRPDELSEIFTSRTVSSNPVTRLTFV